MPTALTREDLVLVMASGATGPFPLDPIRVMKGCFLISQLGRQAWRPAFEFSAYDYGPFDPSVYRARDVLIQRGLLDEDSSGRYSQYSVTDAGRERVSEIEEDLSETERDWLRSIGQYVTSRSFNKLLEEIYERFPDYATRSVVARTS